MKSYDDVLMDAYTDNVHVKEINFNKYFEGEQVFKGLYKNNKIAIDNNIDTENEKKCILVEELGHHYTSFGNIINQNDIRAIKQEVIARRWGHDYLIPPSDILLAYIKKLQLPCEIADFLNITEEYLHEVISDYRKKYGISLKVDNYLLIFEPYLSVLKLTP